MITLAVCFVAAFTLQAQSLDSVVELIRQGENASARQEVNKLERTDTPKDVVFFLKGLVATSGDSSVFYYEQLIEQYPNSRYNDDARFRMAQMNYAKGLYHTAKSQLAHIIRLRPNSPILANCYYWTGLCFQALEVADSSAIYLQAVVNRFPESDAALLAQGILTNQGSHSSSAQTMVPPPPPASSQTMYAVQVGAFLHQNNALLRKSFFEKKGYPVALRTKVQDNKTLYLIWVGNCKTRSEAKQLGDNLNKQFGISYSLVSEN